MWHASAQGYGKSDSRRVALAGLIGVGDVALGEWIEDGTRGYIVHVKRRLSIQEMTTFGVPEPIDIRGTDQERDRIAALYKAAAKP